MNRVTSCALISPVPPPPELAHSGTTLDTPGRVYGKAGVMQQVTKTVLDFIYFVSSALSLRHFLHPLSGVSEHQLLIQFIHVCLLRPVNSGIHSRACPPPLGYAIM